MATMVDLSKAFNKVDHTLVIEDLYDMKCPSWLLKIIISYLTKRSLIVSFQGATASEKILNSGSGQGTLLGGVLFTVKFNGLKMRPSIPRPMGKPQNCLHLKYYDDTTAAFSINLKKQLVPDPIARPKPLTWHEKSNLILPKSENELQSYLDNFKKFAEENNFSINEKKTKVILFNFSHKFTFPPELFLSHCQAPEVVNTAKILGVQISSDLKWSKNTEYIVSKAMRRIWVLRRLRKLGFGDDFIIEVYKKEIRTLLEYAVQVWHSALTKKDSEKIEKVQKIVIKFLLRQQYESYTEACANLQLQKLSTRRDILCSKFVQKEFRNNTNFFQKNRTEKRRIVSQKKIVHEPKIRTKRHFSSPYVFLSRLLNETHKP